LAAPSFQEGSGSVCAYTWANPNKNMNPAPIILFISVRFIQIFLSSSSSLAASRVLCESKSEF
jgi:hypothetical protein